MQNILQTYGKRILLGMALLVAAYLLLDFNNRVSDLIRLSKLRDSSATRVAELQATESLLQTQIAEATSIAAVEEWARSEGHMIMPGDIPIIPISPSGATPTPTPAPPVETMQVSNWQVWLELFFGQ